MALNTVKNDKEVKPPEDTKMVIKYNNVYSTFFNLLDRKLFNHK